MKMIKSIIRRKAQETKAILTKYKNIEKSQTKKKEINKKENNKKNGM